MLLIWSLICVSQALNWICVRLVTPEYLLYIPLSNPCLLSHLHVPRNLQKLELILLITFACCLLLLPAVCCCLCLLPVAASACCLLLPAAACSLHLIGSSETRMVGQGSGARGQGLHYKMLWPCSPSHSTYSLNLSSHPLLLSSFLSAAISVITFLCTSDLFFLLFLFDMLLCF